MHRILLVDDDQVAVETLRRVSKLEHYAFDGALTGQDALRLAKESVPDVVLIALLLPDMSGLDLLRAIREQCPTAACAVMTGFATVDVVIKAMRLGACDCIQKPALYEDILEVVKRALARQFGNEMCRPSCLEAAEQHALSRWADPIVRFIHSSGDAPTLQQFGRAVGVSAGCFRNWCRTARLPSRRSLLLARALRAVYRQEKDPSERPENLLQFVDLRTITKFMIASGGSRTRLPATMDELLDRQQFIDNVSAIQMLRRTLGLNDVQYSWEELHPLAMLARSRP